MDLRGSLVDTSLRIYPSKNLKTFLEHQPFVDNVPTNIGKLVKGNNYKQKDSDLKQKLIDISLSSEDTKFLNKITTFIEEMELNNLNDNKENTEPIAENKKILKQNIEKECNVLDKGSENNNSTPLECKENDSKTKLEGPYLTTSDIEWLYEYLKERRKIDSEIPYLHVILEGSRIEVPPNEVIKRNPDLEARCVKLRAQQEAREYRKMTKGVDNVRMRFPEDSISYQLKQMNRQLIAIGQFIISIFAGFLFGFRGVEWMVGNLDFGFRLLLGVMCALVIALAEIYFLAKKINEELSVPETTQLGGPPKFADDNLNQTILTSNKPHQD